MDLPPGLQTRPLTMDDAVPVANLVRASEVHDVGEALIDDEDIVGDWQRPSFDLASQSVDLLDNGTLIAFAGVFKGRYADTTVHPDHRGRGLARALLVDSFEVARLRGAQRSELSTDSRTGALGLYLRVGMDVTSVWRHLAIEV